MALDNRELNGMRNFAAAGGRYGTVDQDAVSKFVALAQRVPREKQIKIAETLASRVRSNEPMQHGGKTLTLATMAQIAVTLGSAQ